MSKKINIGVLGCANIAERFVIPAINELSDKFKLCGIASRDSVKAQKFAHCFNTRPYFSYDELLSETNLDAVYIPLPNSKHYKWIKKSFEKGLHVLVEKSMACTYEEVVELNNIAKERGLTLVENFQFQFHSQLRYIKNLLNDDVIGELRNMRSSFGFPPFLDEENIRYSKELGGGALFDAGAYPIKISQIFLGDSLEISSARLYFDETKQVDIWGSGCIRQINGNLSSQISFGFDNFYQCNIELWGSKGKIYTNRIFTAPPGYQPTIEVETNAGKEIVLLEKDNHFNKILLYFHDQVINNNGKEYLRNVDQAKLIHEFMLKAKEDSK